MDVLKGTGGRDSWIAILDDGEEVPFAPYYIALGRRAGSSGDRDHAGDSADHVRLRFRSLLRRGLISTCADLRDVIKIWCSQKQSAIAVARPSRSAGIVGSPV